MPKRVITKRKEVCCLNVNGAGECGKYCAVDIPSVNEFNPDYHQIVIASNVIRFLNLYIHGIAAGRTEEQNHLNLLNASDNFKKLKF